MTNYVLPKNIPVLEGQITLNEYLNELDGPLPEEGAEITTDDTVASRLLRELSVLEKGIAANAATAERERAKITGWETRVNEPLQNKALWIRGQLEQYALHERRTSDRKTISLPFGTLTTRPKDPVWEIGQEFVDWARTSAPEFVRAKYEPIRDIIKKTLVPDSEGNALDVATGVPVPGVKVVVETDYAATIKPNLD